MDQVQRKDLRNEDEKKKYRKYLAGPTIGN